METKMETKKVYDLSNFVYPNPQRPECNHYVDMWRNSRCQEYGWIKNRDLIKHKNCSNIFNNYLECVINHSYK